MDIIYSDKKVEKICRDLRHAKKLINEKSAKKLHKAINIIESFECLHDVIMYPPFNFHDLKGNRKGQHSIDIDGRKSSYRIILEPLDADGKRYDDELGRVDLISKSTKLILIIEVSDHYE